MDFVDLIYIAPELILTAIAMLLLVVGAFVGNKFSYSITRIAAISFILAAVALLKINNNEYFAFNNLFVSNQFTIFVKLILLVSSFFVMIMTMEFFKIRGKNFEYQKFFEFSVLIMLSVVGMMLMVSSNDVMSLYLSLEMQSLCLYILAASNKDSIKSSEAGIKYFILGALASGIILFGASLVYGFAGTTNFTDLTNLFKSLAESEKALPIGVLVGMIMIIIGICFKISAVPFHMWAPDVYEGAPTIITAFFSIVPKVAAISLFVRVLIDAFGGLVDQWRQIIIVISVASMVLGAVAALKQHNIKRLLAYSSIGHVGYILIGLISGSVSGVQAVLIYTSIYAVMSIGVFSCVILMKKHGRSFEEIRDLAGVGKTDPVFAFVLASFMFSMAGIPPLAGFFGKFYIFMSAIESGHYAVAVIGVLTSVVAAYYYIKIVKIMYFDKPEAVLEQPRSYEIRLVLFVATALNLFFFIYPTPLFDAAKAASIALF